MDAQKESKRFFKVFFCVNERTATERNGGKRAASFENANLRGNGRRRRRVNFVAGFRCCSGCDGGAEHVERSHSAGGQPEHRRAGQLCRAAVSLVGDVGPAVQAVEAHPRGSAADAADVLPGHPAEVLP